MDEDERVVAFARSVLPEANVSLHAPSIAPAEEQGVGLYLWEIRPVASVRSHRGDYLQVNLQYLVHTWAPDPTVAHRMLLELAYAAFEDSSLDVLLEPLSAEVWLAFGVPPTPAFRLGTLSRRLTGDRLPKPVLHPLEIGRVQMTELVGSVRTPDGTPVAGAAVEIVGVDRRSWTDADGHFRLRSLPDARTSLRVRVKAKGRQTWKTVEPTDDYSAVVIELDPTEDSHA